MTSNLAKEALPTADLPGWYPSWAKELADLYFSGTTSLFVLHGNVYDLVRIEDDKEAQYVSVADFLATQMFGKWDVVLLHDLARGLRPLAGADSRRLQNMITAIAPKLGNPRALPPEPEKMLPVVDQFLESILLDDSKQAVKSVALLFDYGQYLVPAGDLSQLARSQGANLVRFLAWAQNPYIKRRNIAVCLIAEKLSEVNERLVQNPHVAAIPVPLPGLDERRAFAEHVAAAGAKELPANFAPAEVAELSNGLSLVSLNVLLSQAARAGETLEAERLRKAKKTLIERQCQGLLEFIEPSHTLDLVVGMEAAKSRLRADAEALMHGQLDAAPMGYLLCGPVGTGKTFLAECYAGSIGIPCVKLRNFRSKYVGETEGNLEQMLTVLRSLGPVIVIIDEADAALGNRRADGDAGTSARVFSMIANQMGDTTYRGKIVWMLITSRPDLLPIDLKRQGRAEVHMPLFYPHEVDELRTMLTVMAKKNKVALEPNAVPELDPAQGFSGADVESIVLSAKRDARTAGRALVSRADLEHAAHEFIPAAAGLEKEMQELAAVLECTQLNFLPPRWQEKVGESGGRSRLQERMVAIRQLLEN